MNTPMKIRDAKWLERQRSKANLKKALKANHERNRDLSADEVMNLANEAVNITRQKSKFKVSDQNGI